MNRRISILLRFTLILPLMYLLGACGSSRKVATVAKYRVDPKWTFSATEKPSESERPLIAEARKWIGTPYKYGGKDRNGTDCSGFVMEVYRIAADIKIPRSTWQQREYCRVINISELKPGDLVFFSGSGKDKVSHVGLYIGAGQMLHASSSKGVIMSDLTENYYIRTFHSFGRVEAYRKSAFSPAPPVKEIDYNLLDNAIEERIDSIYTNLLD